MSIDAEFLSMLVCVEAKKPLVYVPAQGQDPEVLFCPESRLCYPFDDEGGFPVMLVDEALRVDEAEAARLMARAQRP